MIFKSVPIKSVLSDYFPYQLNYRPRMGSFFSILGIGMVVYSVSYITILSLIDCDLLLWFCEKIGRSPRKLKGKVVFITGASSGIGEHTALALAKRGVKLVLTARRQLELERVKRKCIESSKGQLEADDVLVIPNDITNLSSHEDLFTQAVQHFGKVDILFNNAGRSQRALFDEIDLVVDRQMFELNLFAIINLTRIALRHFNKTGTGHVGVVSSLAGILPIPYSSSYTGVKHAIHGYFDGLRLEKLEKNIAVTLICPGPVYTNFLSECFTGKNGEKYGIDASPKDKRMTAERCGELCAVALANRLDECWVARFPLIIFTYSNVYFPAASKWFIRKIGPKRMFALRDSKPVDLGEVRIA